MFWKTAFTIAILGLLQVAAVFSQPRANAIRFEVDVRPILSDNCFACHGPDESKRMAGLRLDTREGALSQRHAGAVIVPGKPEESLLYRRISEVNPTLRMPPVSAHKELTEAQKQTLKRWIAEGGVWKEHWSFTPPVRPPLPLISAANWARTPIDKFILSKLESVGLAPAPQADLRSLIRRASLDIRGVPPSAEEIAGFLNDKSVDAYERMVDRFLASPQFGEHRAHYWLDAARYGDTNGLHYDNYRGGIWHYRDWVVSAFNRNLSYDKFVVEQLAGDLLPKPTLDQLIATGFNRNHLTTNENGIIEEEVAVMYAKDQADTAASVFLGLTLACATCHDHKFDPISQKDHYALEAFFNNTTEMIMDDNRPDPPPIVFVPQPEDRAEWLSLNQKKAELRRKLEEIEKRPNAGFERWLRTKDARLAHPLGERAETLAVWADTAVKVSVNGKPAEIPSPTGVTLGESPWTGGRALTFDGKSSLELPQQDGITGDEPFAISLWIYTPKIVRFPGLTGNRAGTPAIASKLTRASRDAADPDALATGGNRGWVIDLDQGVPGLRLYGDGGAVMRALALRNAPIPERTWTHLTFTYDGSRKEEGLSLYVNGIAVPLQRGGFGIQNANVRRHLAGSLVNRAPIRLGGDNATSMFTGSIADFRIFNRVITEEQARLMAAWPRIAATSDLTALKLYFLHQKDSGYRENLAALEQVAMMRTRIQNRADTALVMEERPGSKATAHLLFRGQYDQPRDEIEANTPSALPPLPASYPRNRLGLAKWLVAPENPLLARVAVNRFWQEIFGAGIVRTPGDFGSQGEPPTHPELLDWLAVEFRESGWDVKKLFRLLLTSAAYRQSAAASEQRLKRDPDNRLLSRGPHFRLDGEMIRDLALSASGLLVTAIGGPPVKPYQPAGVWEATSMPVSNTKRYTQDSGQSLYRRSLYTLWKRSAPPASMEIFDGPTRESCVVRRDRTDTPLQALVVMNDLQLVEAARNLAQLAMSKDSFAGRLDYITLRLLARTFEPEERTIAEKSYKGFLRHYDANPADASKLVAVGESKAPAKLPQVELAALTMLANQVLSLDETLNK